MTSSTVDKRIALECLAFYLRRSPFERGRWRLVPKGISWARDLLREGKPRIVRTRHGFRLLVEPGDWLGRHVFVTGDYEPATSLLIKSLLRPGDTVVDVGANIGFFSLLASRCVGSTGKVIAFEPLPRTRRELERNVSLNRAANVVIREEAACDRSEGMICFYEGPPDHRGTSSCRPLEKTSGVHEVRAGRLDDILGPGSDVALVKIDVEGAECQVLDGMGKLLERGRPDLIIEVTDSYLRAMGCSALELCCRLRSIGYRMYAIDYDALVPVADDLTGMDEQFNAWFTTRHELPASLQLKNHRLS